MSKMGSYFIRLHERCLATGMISGDDFDRALSCDTFKATFTMDVDVLRLVNLACGLRAVDDLFNNPPVFETFLPTHWTGHEAWMAIILLDAPRMTFLIREGLFRVPGKTPWHWCYYKHFYTP